jgi:uncharacterized protein YkwD
MRGVVANALGLALFALIVAGVGWIYLNRGAADELLVSLSGGNVVRVGEQPLYRPNDPWAGYLAPESDCPGGESTDLSLSRQRLVMLCLLNWARRERGLSELPESSLLSDAALLKAQDIERCRNFAHAACGKEPAAGVRGLGYLGDWGENLYIGAGRLGAPRVAVDGWLNSRGHRENLFREEWSEQGIAVLQVSDFFGAGTETLWVSHFGGDDEGPNAAFGS